MIARTLVAAVAALFLVAAGASAAEIPTSEVIAPGVTIDGIAVGGLTGAAARDLVIAERVLPRRAPLAASLNRHRFAIKPVAVGYSADVDYSVQVALLYGRRRLAEPQVDVALRQRVDAKRLRAVLTYRGAKHRIAPRDAELAIRGMSFVRVAPRVGRTVQIVKAERLVTRAILGVRTPRVHVLPTKRLLPAVTSIGSGVLIDRNAFALTLYKGKRTQKFQIAVGAAGYGTPAGTFSVVTLQRHPWWYPPDSPWAEGLEPVPPGPSNPLGTRWMGLSSPGIGIHGTPSSGSIGTAASHGCIRMRISDAEALFEQLEVGDPVIIR